MKSSVLITGASSGIGAATAAHLAERGHRVFGTHRRAMRELPHDPIEWIPMDVCDDVSVASGIADLMSRSERLDAVVCNAGFGIFGSVEEVPLDEARAQFETNFFGVLRVLRAVLPIMREAGSGRVLLVGSLAGRAPIPFQAHYSASKAAIDALALSLHNEVRPHGIRVSLIEPGDIATPFNDAMTWLGDAPSAEPDAVTTETSPYANARAACEETIRISLPKAPPPACVAETIERALTARRPRVRYAVGADSRLVPVGKRLFPDWLNLALIRNHFGL